jgi:hypothetical protein
MCVIITQNKNDISGFGVFYILYGENVGLTFPIGNQHKSHPIKTMIFFTIRVLHIIFNKIDEFSIKTKIFID